MEKSIAIYDCGEEIKLALQKLREAKPGDKSELDRRFAVTITELEKVYAYFNTYIVENEQ